LPRRPILAVVAPDTPAAARREEDVRGGGAHPPVLLQWFRAAHRAAKGWDTSIVVAVLIWIVLRSYLVEAFRIPSASMENTLLIGDFRCVNKAGFGGELEIPVTGIHCCRLPAFRAPRRQEVVVFRSVEDSTPDLNIVKRVICIPGDTLQMAHDTVIRNGQRLDEPYALHTALTPVPDEEFRLQQIKAWQLPQYGRRDPVHYHPTPHDRAPIPAPPHPCFAMRD